MELNDIQNNLDGVFLILILCGQLCASRRRETLGSNLLSLRSHLWLHFDFNATRTVTITVTITITDYYYLLLHCTHVRDMYHISIVSYCRDSAKIGFPVTLAFMLTGFERGLQ